mgnify:FL=1
MKNKALLFGLVLSCLLSMAAQSDAQSQTAASRDNNASQNATAPVKPLPESDLKAELRDLHEDLRRMEGALHDLGREAGRRQVVANSLLNNDAYIADPWETCMPCALPSLIQDSTTLGAYLKPRAAFLNQSLSSLDSLSSAVHELAGRLALDPDVSSNVKAKVDLDVLSDAIKDFDTKLLALKALCNVEAPDNAQILMAVGTLKDSVKGIDTVGGRLWKAEKK